MSKPVVDGDYEYKAEWKATPPRSCSTCRHKGGKTFENLCTLGVGIVCPHADHVHWQPKPNCSNCQYEWCTIPKGEGDPSKCKNYKESNK